MAPNGTVRLGDVCKKIGSGATPRGGQEAYKGGAMSVILSKINNQAEVIVPATKHKSFIR